MAISGTPAWLKEGRFTVCSNVNTTTNLASHVSLSHNHTADTLLVPIGQLINVLFITAMRAHFEIDLKALPGQT